MAKTLLHHYPKGCFEPVIFDSRPTVGGLWAVSRPISAHHDSNSYHKEKQPSPDFIDCFMRTNLSRFTVSFSDHHWHHHNEPNDGQDEENMFPQAWKVGDYLKSYATRFLPEETLRLSCRVTRTQRNTDAAAPGRWTVNWTQSKKGSTQSKGGENHLSESFDYLVVASGYFSRPYIPSIAGLDEFPPERIMHSSSLRSNDQLLRNCLAGNPGGRILVVGGSMSGAEAAASIALDISSATSRTLSTNSNASTSSDPTGLVHHVSTRPFWAVPTYLPANDQPGSFLPLDIVMYDLARRPPGDIQYALGPITPDRASLVHTYFETLLGSDQSDVAAALALSAEDDRKIAPWVAVTDHYAEFVRAGDIIPTQGRVSAAQWVADATTEGSGIIEIKTREGRSTTIDNIAAVVLATGFSPFESLAFLPEDVRATLEYTENDTVFPLVLNEKGTWNPKVPDLGFVGMYRGPYWGVMEMQARALAHQWYDPDAKDDETKPDTSYGTAATTESDAIAKVKELRELLISPSPSHLRAQFPMGDYVGLMETFARELSIPRLSLSTTEIQINNSERSGPVIPGRYFVPSLSADPDSTESGEDNTGANRNDNGSIITSLQDLLLPSSQSRKRGLCKAVLRALHGKWRYERTTDISSDTSNIPSAVSQTSSGQASIRLHKVSDSNTGSKIEYIYEENGLTTSTTEEVSAKTAFRLAEDHYIHTIRHDSSDNTHLPLRGRIEFMSVEQVDSGTPNQYIHSAREILSDATGTEKGDQLSSREYIFNMAGVRMTAWEERVLDKQSNTVRVTKYTR